MVGAIDATRLLRRMRDMTDEDELRQASEDLHWVVRSYARNQGWSEQKAFTGLFRSALPGIGRDEYRKLLRFYRGKKMQRGPKK